MNMKIVYSGKNSDGVRVYDNGAEIWCPFGKPVEVSDALGAELIARDFKAFNEPESAVKPKKERA